MKFEIELKEVPTAINQPDGWYIETDNNSNVVFVLNGVFLCAGMTLSEFERLAKKAKQVEPAKQETMLSESFALKMLAVASGKVKDFDLNE